MGITAEAVLGDTFDEEHRDKYALYMAIKANNASRKIKSKAGKRLNKTFTSTAASLEFKFNSRNFLTKYFRKKARKMHNMSVRQHRLNRRDELYRERWKEIEEFRQKELAQWQKVRMEMIGGGGGGGFAIFVVIDLFFFLLTHSFYFISISLVYIN